MQGTDSYNAPERSNKSDMRKADAWAIGCVVYELCTGGQRLFNWRNDREKYMQLAQLYDPNWVPPRVPAHAAGWQEVIDGLLAVDPMNRLLPEEVLRLPIFECDLRHNSLESTVHTLHCFLSCILSACMARI